MVADELDYVVGVDTHLDEHVLAVIAAPSGAVVAQRSIQASGRGYTAPEDVERMFEPVLGHRLVFSPSFIAQARGRSREEILREEHGVTAVVRRRKRNASAPAPADLMADLLACDGVISAVGD